MTVPGVEVRGAAGPAEYGEQLDCLKPNLQTVQAATHRKDARTGAVPCVDVPDSSTQPPGRGAMPSEGIQGDEWAT